MAFRPHYGTCVCCKQGGLIVVRSGLRHQCNEKQKSVKKENKKKSNQGLRKALSQALTIPKLVKQLDAVFSLYIRHKYADNKGNVRCYTSGKSYPIKQIQCGHFHSRRHYSLRWDERNAKPQSKAENLFNQGNGATFAKKLVEEYGPEILDILEMKKNNKMKLDRFTLGVLIKEYEEKLEKEKQKYDKERI